MTTRIQNGIRRAGLLVALLALVALSPAPIVDREASAPGVTAPQREHTEEEIASQQWVQGVVEVPVEAPTKTDTTFVNRNRADSDARDVLSNVAEQKAAAKVLDEAEKGMQKPRQTFPWVGIVLVFGTLVGAFAAFRAWASRSAPPLPAEKRRFTQW